MALKKLPIGVENFEKIQTQNFYYVDKTGLIIDLLHNWGEVNLFTRPRRFGKSLNMSMLQTFFEIGCKKELFTGLKITQEKELCDEYMGKFPVVSITLKGIDGSSKDINETAFEAAKNSLKSVIGMEARRFSFLTQSDKLTEEEKKSYIALTVANEDGKYTMSNTALENSLLMLSVLLAKHYGRKVILLIDEYDVPLDKAFQAGYYNEMLALIRNLFTNVLKTNSNIRFAVLTGCLRVSKESIFTGLNNLNVMTMTDEYFSDAFGFTEQEVIQLLEYYNCEDALDTVREWYDGYRFGSDDIYCPWDVIKYCQALLKNKQAFPQNYWANTSGNALVRRFIDKATLQTKKEIEQLIAGECVVKPIHQELTYSELDDSIDNLWSVLFTTGYLTQSKQIDGKRYELKIPNREIHELFVEQIEQWFHEVSAKDTPKLDAFCNAFPNGDTETIENLFNDYLWNTISVRDTAVSKERKENFYHGILLGLLGHKENWLVMSNVESGEGYSDILVEVPESRTGVVIEMKYAENDKLEAGCKEALQQINAKQYDAHLLSDGMQTVVKYGIACFRKHCKVVRE
jgi:hypothetical protein